MVGRFLNADGFVLAGGGSLSTNMYFYCANNPIHRTDPSGKHFFDTPLSTAALQTMSQTQRDEYYKAKVDYEKTKNTTYVALGSVTIHTSNYQASIKTGSYDLGKGYKARVDEPHAGSNPLDYHVHVYKDKNEITTQYITGGKKHDHGNDEPPRGFPKKQKRY